MSDVLRDIALEAAFLAALRWSYHDTADYVTGKIIMSRKEKALMSEEFLADLACMQRAYKLLKRTSK